MRLDADLGEAGHGQKAIARADQHMDRPVHGSDDRTDGSGGRQAGGQQDVGAGFLVRLQAADGIGKVRPAMEIVIRSARKHEPERKLARGLRRGADAIGSVRDV